MTEIPNQPVNAPADPINDSDKRLIGEACGALCMAMSAAEDKLGQRLANFQMDFKLRDSDKAYRITVQPLAVTVAS